MAKQSISTPVIRRLPRYYRFLRELEEEEMERVSSQELALRMGFSASQIRQDFNCFGAFGQQGYGYNVRELREIIGSILGVDESTGVILIGAGNLGKAIATHLDFQKRGCRLIGVFDNNPALHGTKTAGLTIQSMQELPDFCKLHHPQVAVLCIPKGAAQELADHLVALGICGFWNFSHFDLSITNPQVIVENVHLGDSLMTLAYWVHHEE
ncbi:MAG: redox-sensing transcriptional repressor Rex [Ruminococcus sp.]|jgi:redox-sensing transcriptional repressor|nr:redox-sensing transcriptional repressor Rex [Ruminococcus sp.]